METKLDEVVGVASRLQYEDHNAAVEYWSAAHTQIQAIWSKSKSSQITKIQQCSGLQKNYHTSEETTTSLENVRRPTATDMRQNITKPQWPPPDQKVKTEVKNVDDSEENITLHGDERLKPLIKQEMMTSQEADREEVVKSSEPNEVQSVHLIVSADPVLVPKMNKYKKFYKNEMTGKMETAYQCEKCPKQCRTALALYKHRTSHVEILECPICHQKLSNRHALNAHKRTHTGERPFQCTKCLSRFTNRGNLARHIASHDGEKPWQCAKCGKRYTEKKSLKVHMRAHTGEKPYACSQCPKRFAQSGILQAHMLIHTDQFGHLCDVCGRSFRQRSQLVTHHQRHEGVKPFACPECNRRFTTKGDMDRHLRTHTGERPFPCDVCGSSFARPQTLQEHKNRHFNFKPYVCKICGKNFYEHSACSRHVKRLHSRETGNTPVSENIIRLTSSEQEQGDKNKNMGDQQGERQGDSKEGGAVKDEEREEERDIKHHIFVMHTTDNEEPELITIAELPNSLDDASDGGESAVSCGGCGALVFVDNFKDHANHCTSEQEVSVTEWLVQDQTDSPGNTMEVSIEGDSERNMTCVGGDK